MIKPKIHVHEGTLEEANTIGYIMERKWPFEIHGFKLKEEFVGDMAQELWECEWQQRNMLIVLPIILLLTGICSILINPMAIVGGLILTALAFKILCTFQTAASEEFSHAVSVQASLLYDNMTPERAEECFIGNLGGYQYHRVLKPENVRKNYPKAKQWVLDNKAMLSSLLS